MPEREKPSAGGAAARRPKPWYAGDHADALTYLLIAIFFVEMIVGGVAFFYGIMHAAPESPGGPPVARFPWLAWGLAAVLAPVGLLLVVHLAGTWLSRALTREEAAAGDGGATPRDAASDADVPPGLRRFYATVRNAPTLVVLVGILLLGAALFFVDGALSALGTAAVALVPHVPWIAVSLAAFLAFCVGGRLWLLYRQRRLEHEYAWRREVLERTGLVLMDKASVALPADSAQAGAGHEARAALTAPVVEVSALPPADDTQHESDTDTPDGATRPDAEDGEKQDAGLRP